GRTSLLPAGRTIVRLTFTPSCLIVPASMSQAGRSSLTDAWASTRTFRASAGVMVSMGFPPAELSARRNSRTRGSTFGFVAGLIVVIGLGWLSSYGWVRKFASFGRLQHCGALVLHEEHDEFRRLGLARVAADDVNILGAFIESLTGCQGHFFPALHLHDD